jgi:hypothetical protein
MASEDKSLPLPVRLPVPRILAIDHENIKTHNGRKTLHFTKEL